MTQRFIDFSNKRADAVRDLRQADPPSQLASPPPSDSCVFCAIIYEAAPAFKVYEDDHVIAFLDVLPIIDGSLHSKHVISRLKALLRPYAAGSEEAL